MSRSAEEILEFDGLREILRRYTTCAPGRRAVKHLAPTMDRVQLENTFALTREAMAYLRAGSDLGFGSLADPAAWLARVAPAEAGQVAPGAVLTAAELLDAASLLDTVAWLKQNFRADAAKYPLLAARAAALADFRHILVAIRRAILPNGEISDDASSELRRIRANIGRTRDTIQKTLREILRNHGEEPGTDYITLRNERFVIPVRSAERRQVQGVVHGSSATGQTVFVEPLQAIELNNKLVQLAEDEAAEIARILSELTDHLQREIGTLNFAAGTIAEFDCLFARARFAREFNCAIPAFSDVAEIRLEAVRHPVLEDKLRGQARAIVPITLALGGDETVLVISGPNTGGKTVALKTVGLAMLAAQSGIPVAAESAQLPVFDRVLADIGDQQSITADLSTFSAHVLNLRAMLEAATERSLVLVDEVGTGTAPEEGSALAVALLEEFRARRCLTLATTHHDRLKAYASSTPGVLNAAVEFDDVNMYPTYRLLIGIPGGSSGIEIARRLGLSDAIVQRARAQLAPETREAAALIAYLHRSRDELEEMKRQAGIQLRELEEERRKLQSEWIERQRRRLAELEQNFSEMLKHYEQEIARAVEAVKDREARARIEKEARRRVTKARGEVRAEADAAVVAHLAESQQDLGMAAEPQQEAVTPERLVPGVRVRVRGFTQPVILRRRDASSAEVEAGPLRMKVPLAEITAIVSQETARRSTATERAAARVTQSGVTVHAQPPEVPAKEEINVIGCTVEEAARRVDKFLDSAALANKPRVRIIHGHGTGALRRGLAEFLSTHPLVEQFHAEEAERGGNAVTIVELKG